MTKQDLLDFCNEIQNFVKTNEWQEKQLRDKEKYINKLEAEVRKLKYEYKDSKRKRDQPLPYKWKQSKHGMLMYCPKCEQGISNWYNYCCSCGQKIGQGNPLPEMEMKDDG